MYILHEVDVIAVRNALHTAISNVNHLMAKHLHNLCAPGNGQNMLLTARRGQVKRRLVHAQLDERLRLLVMPKRPGLAMICWAIGSDLRHVGE